MTERHTMKRAIVALSLAACGGHLLAVEPRHADGVRIKRHAEALFGAKSTLNVAIPFGQGQNGNALVLAFLDQAQASGARYVSDVAFHMVFRRRGVMVECETRIVFGDDPSRAPKPVTAAPADPPSEYSTDVSSYEPHASTYTTTEDDVACKKQGVQQVDYVPRYDSTFDVDVARIIDEVPIDKQIRIDYHDACAMKRFTREVTRYDYQTKLGFVPPAWKDIATRFADEPLFEAPPSCSVIDPAALGPQPTHRLTATVVYKGEVRQAEPLRSPSAPPPPLGVPEW